MIKLFNKTKKRRYDIDAPIVDIQNSGNGAVTQTIDQSISNFFTGGKIAGVSVTEQTAMAVSSVYACVGLIAGAIASIPLPIYQRTGDNRKQITNDITYLLNEQPNKDYSAAVFWESMAGSLLLKGDAFALINRGKHSGKIIGFQWVHSDRVIVRKSTEGLVYHISPNTQLSTDSKAISVRADDMLHIPGLGFNGLRGMSQLQYALRHSAGIAIAAGQYSESFFQNGARPDFAVEIEGKLSPEQVEMVRNSWSEKYQGLDRAHLPALLPNGSKVHELTMNAEDTQLISTRQFQVEDICRIFGVPPFMVGHTQNTSSWGTGVEQMGIGFVKYTLGRHLTKIAQEINRKLWPVSDKYFVEHKTAGLERGDFKTRMDGYRVGLGRAGEPAWLTVNEVRKFENLPAIKGGDQLFTAIPSTTDPTQP